MTNLTGPSGNTSRVEARGLSDGISKFKFIVSMVTWYNILHEVNITSKILQNQETDLSSAINHLEATKKYLSECRCDEGFKSVLSESTKIANDLDIPAEFDTVIVRSRRKKRNFDYEAKDEAPLQDPQQKFKTEFYYVILDMAVQSIEERFQQMKQYNSVFGFLHNISNLKKQYEAYVLEKCKNLEHMLTSHKSKDIDAEDLHFELMSVSRRLTKTLSPQDVLLFLLQQKFIDDVPNVNIALRILLTLPVSVASGERSFSKLKLTKTYIRSTMTETRLTGLATVSIEHSEASALDLAELVRKFAKEKARKVML